jgi:flagella basal body P-ring formation protein FlgA
MLRTIREFAPASLVIVAIGLLLGPDFADGSQEAGGGPERLGNLLSAIETTISSSGPEPANQEAGGLEATPGNQAQGSLKPEPEKAPPNTLLRAPELLALIKEEIVREYQPSGELFVSLYRKWHPLQVPAHGWDLVISDFPAENLVPLMALRVRIDVANRTLHEIRVPIVCELWEDVLVPLRPINHKERLEPDDFESQRINTLRLRTPLVPDSTDIANYELKQAALAGEPLTWRSIRPRPVVRQGQMVEVKAEDGRVAISMRGYALEDGANGEFIRVRNLTSRKEFQAQVIDEQSVQVYF